MPDRWTNNEDEIERLKVEEQETGGTFIGEDMFDEDDALVLKGVSNPTYNAITHISLLIASFTIGFSFVGPALTWMIWKDEYPDVVEHAKEAANFSISMILQTMLFALLLVVGISLTVMSTSMIVSTIGGVFTAAAAIYGIILMLTSLIAPIVAAVKASKSQHFRYPLTKRFIK